MASPTCARPPLSVFDPKSAALAAGYPVPGTWRINGFPVCLVCWTAEEWERLDLKPEGVQTHPNGVRVLMWVE